MMTQHDPNTVLCIDCKHFNTGGGVPGYYRSDRCMAPKARSVIDGSGGEMIGTRFLKCQGMWWELRPAPPPEPLPRLPWWKRIFN